MSAFGDWRGRPKKSRWEETVEAARKHWEECNNEDTNHDEDTFLTPEDRKKAIELLETPAANAEFTTEEMISLSTAIGSDLEEKANGGWPEYTTMPEKMAATAWLQHIYEKNVVNESLVKLTEKLRQSDEKASDTIAKEASSEEEVVRIAHDIPDSENGPGESSS